MLARFDRLFSVQRAVGGFTCYDLTTAEAVLEAAERARSAVILLVSQVSMRARKRPNLVHALAGMAEAASVPVGVQLDHTDDLDLVRRAVDAGITAVMADGSRLCFEENVALARAARSAFEGVDVEAELGHVAGSEDETTASDPRALTDPDQVAEFVTLSGAHCLAVSIGNVHGTYRSPPRLDWERLVTIRRNLGRFPISLHGASGIQGGDVAKAVALGVRKINFNTELRARYFEELRRNIGSASDHLNLQALIDSVVAGVSDTVETKIELIREEPSQSRHIEPEDP